MKRKLNFQDKEFDYLALSSSNKYEALKTYANDYDEIYLALDNDESGNLFIRKSMELLLDMD